MEYTLATMNDLPAIKSLLARYHKDTISQEEVVSKTTYFLLFKSIKNLDFTGSFK